jgi:hypothetical protein
VAQGFGGCGGFVVRVSWDGVEVGAEIGAAFERAADDVAGAKADGESEGEDDASEENSKGELDDGAADLEVVEDHGGGKDEDEPLDAEREEAGILELCVDGADEDGALEEARDESAGDEEEDGSDGVGEVGKDEEGDLGFAGEGGVECGDADETADGDTAPEDDTGEQRGGAMGGGPVGDGGRGVAGEPLVELGGGEAAAEKRGEAHADGGHDDERKQKSDESREKARQFEEDLVSGLTKCLFNLLPHERFSLRGAGLLVCRLISMD